MGGVVHLAQPETRTPQISENWTRAAILRPSWLARMCAPRIDEKLIWVEDEGILGFQARRAPTGVWGNSLPQGEVPSLAWCTLGVRGIPGRQGDRTPTAQHCPLIMHSEHPCFPAPPLLQSSGVPHSVNPEIFIRSSYKPQNLHEILSPNCPRIRGS